MKKEDESLKPSKSRTFEAARGTAIWGFNQFREDALVQLMFDLLDKEISGLENEQGKIVSKALEKVSFSLSAIPDKFWIRSSIMGAFDKFKEAYIKWNEISGTDDNARMSRGKALKKMKKARHKLASVVRKNMFILSEALDLKLIDSIYEALGSIPKALPGIFINLSKALLRINKKKTEE